jgi:UDP-3-O-[3-hydroxymyristoyl] glucosamine N-acyltransferase
MTPTRKNNGVPKSLSLDEIARLVDGEVVGDRHLTITGVAGIQEAKKGDITFLANAKYLPFLSKTAASAVITSREIESDGVTLIRTADPSKAFSLVIPHFAPPTPPRAPGVHASAVVSPKALVGKNIYIGPCVVIEEGASVGDGSVLEAGVYIGREASVGRECSLYPNVVLREYCSIGDRVIIHPGAVIGGDGFGFETTGDGHVKIPHTGTVVIEDDVEIGANACVDRGRFDKTWIKKGTKIDNLVQIAHNVVIGENSLVISQAGISGSTRLGKNVVLAGQCGIVGHIELGDGVVVGARAGVTKSVPAGTVVLGQPAKPIAEQKRLFALIARLPELFKEFAELKKKIK